MIILQVQDHDDKRVGLVRCYTPDELSNLINIGCDNNYNFLFLVNSSLIRLNYIGNSVDKHGWAAYGNTVHLHTLFGERFVTEDQLERMRA